MQLETIIGIVAGTCTTLAVIPQLIKSIRTKKVMDVSPGMFLILISGLGLWVVYGCMKNDVPIIVTNGISFLLNLSMLGLMFFFKAEKK